MSPFAMSHLSFWEVPPATNQTPVAFFLSSEERFSWCERLCVRKPHKTLLSLSGGVVIIPLFTKHREMADEAGFLFAKPSMHIYKNLCCFLEQKAVVVQ